MSRQGARVAAAVGLVVVIGVITAAAAMLSRDPDRLSERGRQALDDHDLARAEASFRQALGSDPAHVDALTGLGWTYLLAGQPAAAMSAFERCKELAPTRPECLRGLASGALAEGEAARARTLLQTALEANPDDPGVQSSLGLLSLKEGDVEGAAMRYESLVARFPDEAEYALGLGVVRLKQDRAEETLSLVEEALALEGTPLRYQAQLHLLRSRAIVAQVAGRVDPQRCEETVPPLLTWLDAADRAVDQAEATGVGLPTLADTQRQVRRSRGLIEDSCPGVALGDPVDGLD